MAMGSFTGKDKGNSKNTEKKAALCKHRIISKATEEIHINHAFNSKQHKHRKMKTLQEFFVTLLFLFSSPLLLCLTACTYTEHGEAQ